MEYNVKIDFSDLIERLQEKYKDNELAEIDFVETVEFAVSQFVRLKNDPDLNTFDSIAKSWIKRACFESLDRITKLGVTGGIKQYSENGYQFTLDGVEISTALASEIIPKVGYPR